MNTPNWTELVAMEPRLGSLLAEARSFRGNDPERFFWAPGGIHDRLARLLSAHDWPDILAFVDALDTATGTCWQGLAAPKGEATDDDDFSELADSFWHIAQDAEKAPIIAADGREVSPALVRALAGLAHAISCDDGGDDGPALDRIEAARRDLARALASRK